MHRSEWTRTPSVFAHWCIVSRDEVSACHSKSECGELAEMWAWAWAWWWPGHGCRSGTSGDHWDCCLGCGSLAISGACHTIPRHTIALTLCCHPMTHTHSSGLPACRSCAALSGGRSLALRPSTMAGQSQMHHTHTLRCIHLEALPTQYQEQCSASHHPVVTVTATVTATVAVAVAVAAAASWFLPLCVCSPPSRACVVSDGDQGCSVNGCSWCGCVHWHLCIVRRQLHSGRDQHQHVLRLLFRMSVPHDRQHHRISSAIGRPSKAISAGIICSHGTSRDEHCCRCHCRCCHA